MRRWASVLVQAFALALAIPSFASAAPITFDLTGVVGSWIRSTDQNAANPAMNGGTCTPGMQSPPAPVGAGNDCFRYAFAAGSSVTIDITGDAVTLLGGSLIVDSVTRLVFDTIILTQHFETTLAGGAVGTLHGDYILWSTPSWSTTVGTIVCGGANCSWIDMPQGQVFAREPIFTQISGSLAEPRMFFGLWRLDPSHTVINESSLVVNRWSGSEGLQNRRSGAFTFAPIGLGAEECTAPVGCPSPWDIPEAPEPAVPMLVLSGLAAVASARRRRTR